MSNLDELNARIASINESLESLRMARGKIAQCMSHALEALNKVKLAATEQLYDITQGTVVVSTDKEDTRQFVIVDIYPDDYPDKPSVVAVKRLESGGVGRTHLDLGKRWQKAAKQS